MMTMMTHDHYISDHISYSDHPKNQIKKKKGPASAEAGPFFIILSICVYFPSGTQITISPDSMTAMT